MLPCKPIGPAPPSACGATGQQVMPKVGLTDSHHNAVTRTITRAYDMR
ncbi:hypothetical protein AB0C61_32830 [Streptomyces sp. NPDC048680]